MYCDQVECYDAVDTVARKINSRDPDMMSHVIMSIFKIAAAEANVPTPASVLAQQTSSSSSSDYLTFCCSIYILLLYPLTIYKWMHYFFVSRKPRQVVILNSFSFLTYTKNPNKCCLIWWSSVCSLQLVKSKLDNSGKISLRQYSTDFKRDIPHFKNQWSINSKVQI